MLGFGKPWLKRDFKDYAEFHPKVGYVIRHLDRHDRKKVEGKAGKQFESWQAAKELSVITDPENGRGWRHFKPADLIIHPTEELFRVNDGISKLRAFRRKGVPRIRATLRVGGW
ncbi:hypothetical protein JXB02_00910 [Candidatus Woesearchaeota archaeon]|nr:hypothetical protein [Candidatus Woesearchaeota archaeon]